MCLTSVYFYVIIVISPALKGDLDSARIVAQRALNPLDTHTHTHTHHACWWAHINPISLAFTDWQMSLVLNGFNWSLWNTVLICIRAINWYISMGVLMLSLSLSLYVCVCVCLPISHIAYSRQILLSPVQYWVFPTNKSVIQHSALVCTKCVCGTCIKTTTL